MTIHYQGAYSEPYRHSPRNHPGGAPPPVYDDLPAAPYTPVTRNPYRDQFTQVIATLGACPVLPRLCTMLAHELQYKLEASWSTETSALHELLLDLQQLAALLTPPPTPVLLATTEETSAA